MAKTATAKTTVKPVTKPVAKKTAAKPAAKASEKKTSAAKTFTLNDIMKSVKVHRMTARRRLRASFKRSTKQWGTTWEWPIAKRSEVLKIINGA
jgi:hypothetical protein